MPNLALDLPDDLDAEVRDAAAAAGLTVEEFAVRAVRERVEAERHAGVMAVARRIALEHPELSEAVWGMLDKVERA